MSSRSSHQGDDYPSLLWVTLPPIILLSAWFARKWYLARRLKVHGIGKGAPGFQTNVRRIRVTPEIAARLRRGEEVSPEEIAAASALAEEQERQKTTGVYEKATAPATDSTPPTSHSTTNEWLPESVTGPKKRSKGRRK
ncbi:hypothetical protein Moror_12612 [Moniliophthora roreri MCA 2997]|uniref:Uncharacterized protein n=2 Tax=Moniliophthora roreri TaxID=221103 RepID=V2XSS2_MONRO|nr:hypothetical protein Moror_12612 [Moniliophthora roreri MCA 2997]